MDIKLKTTVAVVGLLSLCASAETEEISVSTVDELKAAFSKYGTVVSVQMPRNHYTGKSKGFGFVGMRDRAEAEKACEALRGKEIGGRPIKTNITQNAAPETVLG